jgi:hypothetical protein
VTVQRRLDSTPAHNKGGRLLSSLSVFRDEKATSTTVLEALLTVASWIPYSRAPVVCVRVMTDSSDEFSDYFYDWIQVVENSQLYDTSSIAVSRSDWIKGISLSVLASLIGAASKLAIRKSWLLQRQIDEGDGLHHHETLDDSRTGPLREDEGGFRDQTAEGHGTLPQVSEIASLPPGKGSHMRTPLLSSGRESLPSREPDSHLPEHQVTDTSEAAAADSHEPVTDDGSSSDNSSSNSELFWNRLCSWWTKSKDYQGRCGLACCYLGRRASPTRDHDARDGLIVHTTNEQPKSLVLPLALRTAGMIGMTTIHPICSVIAMNYASPSILAPFAGLTLVWVIILSGPLLQEQPTRMQICAVALIISGESLVAIFGDHTNTNQMTPKQVVSFASSVQYFFRLLLMSLLHLR